MTKKTPAKDNDVIPVSAAKFMAYLTMAMSLGFVLIIYFVFLKDVFAGAMGALAFAMMLTMSFFSAMVALGSIRKKILCPTCHEHFFAKVIHMFLPPKQCAACHNSLNGVIEKE